MTGDDIIDAHLRATQLSFAILVQALEANGAIAKGIVSESFREHIEAHRHELGTLTLAMLESARETLDKHQQKT